MCRLIIIDDEQTIREGISRHIKRVWPDLSVSGVFSDGKEAIAFLESNDAELVITDIRMSEKSGIDVARYLADNKPQTKVIFLSGYQEFEYARQAMQYNVKYYLSKPVRLQELNQALEELVTQLRTEQQKSSELQKEKQHLETLLTMVKRDFYSDILLGILNRRDAVILRAEKLGLTEDFLSLTRCAIFSVTVSNSHMWHYGYDELYTYLSNLLREITGILFAVPIIQENHEMVYVGEFSHFSSTQALKESLKGDLNMLAQNALELLGIELQYDLMFCGDNLFSLLDYRSPVHSKVSDPVLLEDKYKDLLSKILAHDHQGAQDILDGLNIYSQSLSVSESLDLLTRLFRKICNSISESFQLPEELTFTEVADREALFLQAGKALDVIFQYTAVTSHEFENATISKALEFIAAHLAEDIGLEDVAGFVYLNPVYFSRFFKQHTGTTMTEYLTRLRITQAEELLKTHRYKIHEISRACGYKSSKYFAKIFKQYTGHTPSEYSKFN